MTCVPMATLPGPQPPRPTQVTHCWPAGTMICEDAPVIAHAASSASSRSSAGLAMLLIGRLLQGGAWRFSVLLYCGVIARVLWCRRGCCCKCPCTIPKINKNDRLGFRSLTVCLVPEQSRSYCMSDVNALQTRDSAEN